MAEGAPLLREYTVTPYRGFESLPLRWRRPVVTTARAALRLDSRNEIRAISRNDEGSIQRSSSLGDQAASARGLSVTMRIGKGSVTLLV